MRAAWGGRERWRERIRTLKAEHPLRCEQEEDGPIKPQTAIRAIYDRAFTVAEAIAVAREAAC